MKSLEGDNADGWLGSNEVSPQQAWIDSRGHFHSIPQELGAARVRFDPSHPPGVAQNAMKKQSMYG